MRGYTITGTQIQFCVIVIISFALIIPNGIVVIIKKHQASPLILCWLIHRIKTGPSNPYNETPNNRYTSAPFYCF